MKVKATAAVAPAPVAGDPVDPNAKPKKIREPRKTRESFKTWTEWADYQAGKFDGKAIKMQERASHWRSIRLTEEAGKQQKKLAKLEKLTAALAALQAELGIKA